MSEDNQRSFSRPRPSPPPHPPPPHPLPLPPPPAPPPSPVSPPRPAQTSTPLPPRPQTPPPPADYEEYVARRQREAEQAAQIKADAETAAAMQAEEDQRKTLKSKRSMPSLDFLRNLTPSSRRRSKQNASGEAAADNEDSSTPPMPDLPPPHFNSPTPATRQRYVSAGGNARLADRAEIPGPAFEERTSNADSGADLTKEDVERRIADAEWIRERFPDVYEQRYGRSFLNLDDDEVPSTRTRLANRLKKVFRKKD